MKIVQYPHPALRANCRAVTTLDETVRTTAAKMLELMYEAEGLGLAAPQVALDYRMVVMNFVGDPEKPEMELVAINPVIVDTKKNEKGREGCLSFPGLYQDIRRAKTITAQYYGLDGKLHSMTCSDLAARLWQHEIDHLNGTLFIDKMNESARKNSKPYLDEFIADFEDEMKQGLHSADTVAKL